MATTGGAGPAENSLADVTPRMAVFGRLFGDAIGGIAPDAIPDSGLLVDLVRTRVPRTLDPMDESPVFEAAAFVGEWLRARVPAAWLAEGPYEPHLQACDRTGSVVYLVPLVSILRVASTAGYDGLPALLDQLVADVSNPPHRMPLRAMRVRPPSDAPLVTAWVAGRRHQRGSCAALWRRCQTCSTLVDDQVTTLDPPEDWEEDAAHAASVLAERPFRCACGGQPGETSRFLMVRDLRGARRVADIYVAGTHTRIACWTIRDDDVEPFDASVLAAEMGPT